MIEHDVRFDQEVITVNDNQFIADSVMIPLIKELNNIGLETTQHCSGHGEREAYISIKLKTGMDIQIRREPGITRLVIFWEISD